MGLATKSFYVNLNLCRLFIDTQDYKTANYYLNNCEELIGKIDDLEILFYFYEVKAKYFKVIQNYEQALFFTEKHHIMQDSLDNVEKNYQIEDIEEKHETKKKEAQIKELTLQKELEKKEKEQQQYLFGTAVLLLVLVASFLFYRKTQKSKQDLQAKELQFQIEKTAEIEKTYKYFSSELHDGVKSRLKLIAAEIDEKQAKKLQEIIYEINLISDKAALQEQLPLNERIEWFLVRNVNSRFSTQFEASPIHWQHLHPTTANNLWRITTTALDNSLQYANATMIIIKLLVENEMIILSICDDGDGILPEILQKQSGLGLKNMKDRAESLKGSFEIDSTIGEGTTIEVKVPLLFV